VFSIQTAVFSGLYVDTHGASPTAAHLVGGRREGDFRPLGQGALGEAHLAEVEEQPHIPVGAPADEGSCFVFGNPCRATGFSPPWHIRISIRSTNKGGLNNGCRGIWWLNPWLSYILLVLCMWTGRAAGFQRTRVEFEPSPCCEHFQPNIRSQTGLHRGTMTHMRKPKLSRRVAM
jgi:hypothetical protein